MVFTTNAAENIRLISEGGITLEDETTTAHALDDYEEGTWTPHFADAQTGGIMLRRDRRYRFFYKNR